MKILFFLIAGVIILLTGYEYISAQKSRDTGIGPIKSLTLGKIDNNLVNKGRDIFNTKCIACHTLDQKRIGPPLRNVTNEQTPEYIMNMMLNTQEMINKDERVKQLFSLYKVPMINNQLTTEQAREVLEYLRQCGIKRDFN